MNANNFRLPARRLATVAAATALAAVGPATLAHATEDQGSASAVVLRTGLNVSLLNKSVSAPLAVALNEVQAPQSAEQTALTASLDGVDGGKPFNVLGAEVAEAKATVADGRAEASTRLTHAKLHLPGLPLLSLLEVEQVTSKATCVAGEKPVAAANLLGSVTALGKKVTLTPSGPVEVKVPGVGEVRLDLSQTETTTRTAAATALELKVSVNPLNLGVAEVEGTVTLAKATCEAPAAPPKEPAAEVKPQGAPAPSPAEAGLAETGGSSMTPYLAAGSAALLTAGAGAVALARRRSKN
ncbi:SCO1860 family LAETG-anchored protein [Streptomyces sp. ME02-8801-2C]|uniref:SCO1860 family LAETG-anchored protein n=1 Tax=Streptomyces sp. ME02-8801-2C TaxID=3028680 RepID=UPI0029A3C8B1|nr:SCO1860 family LAETG-anchored protein [Streptomyces sp. ME02-8801-2C]MDX3450663.1 SCO1860 family LAETG-anchored protein [Streptomyces sp. ME02-8801-2C]